MDFSFSEEQTGIKQMAARLFSELGSPERLAELEQSGELVYEPRIWQALAQSEMLGMALSPELGGAGLGLLEVCVMLEQVGRHAAPIPLLPTLVMGALPIQRFGSDEQKKRLLGPVPAGERVLSAALVDAGKPVVATRKGAGWALSGVRECVPWLPLASHVLVPARSEGGSCVFVVETEHATVERQSPTNNEPMGRLVLDATPAEALGDVGEGEAMIDWMTQRAQLGLCAVALGAAQRALILTANYTAEREQFGRPIGTFQAVSQRAGDAYVDVETMKLSLWRAVWLLDEGRDARAEVAMAKYWAAEAGHRVVNAAQHLHGGIGFDRDYPVYRNFLWERQAEFTLGSANRQLEKLGAMIADEAG